MLLEADGARAMSRAQALHALLSVGSEEERRLAAIMLDGPVISAEEVARLRNFQPKPKVMVLAVQHALRQYGRELRAEHAAIEAEMKELGGSHAL